MRRIALIVIGFAVLGWGIAALALGSASLRLAGSGGHPVSPPCLPSRLLTTAALPGSGANKVYVSPAPGSVAATPRTQVSFLGASAAQISGVSVSGSRSGSHPGRFASYTQGDGASFIPRRPFAPGERVTVRAAVAQGAGAAPRSVAFSFRVDTPYPTAKVPEFPAPRAASADSQSFYSAGGLQPPIMTVTEPDRDPAAGDIFTTNGPGPGQYGPLIYTPQGRLVWFGRLPGTTTTAENLSVQSYGGQRVLTWWRGRVLSLGFGEGEDLVMNSRYQTIARVPGGNGLKADLHEFQLAPGGVAYITAYNPVRCDLSTVGGTAGGSIVDTAIQEIDVRTGLVRWEWHSLDHIAAAESEVEAPSGATPWDYFHLNSIDREPDGNLLISARSTWAGYLLGAGSGNVIWRLGGNRSSFKMGPGTKMAWQHDARMLPNGELTFFDDGSNPPIHAQSRALRVKLDASTHRATLLASLTHRNPPLLAASQGNVQTLANGNTVVGYGGVPAISEYAPDGRLLFDAHQPFDMAFYRAYRFPWHARPLTPPAVLASANNTEEETIVHASWNGATDVASWRVLAGAKPHALAVRATMPSVAFEDAVTLPRKYAYAKVQALAADGRVLGSSPTVAVIGFIAALWKAG